MITAEAACSITNSSIANARDSFLFKYAVGQVERFVKEAASCGKRSFSCNINALGWNSSNVSLSLRKALAEDLRKNGFSYNEIWKNIGCVWLEVSW